MGNRAVAPLGVFRGIIGAAVSDGFPRRVRRVRHLRASAGRLDDLPRPVRPAAPRAESAGIAVAEDGRLRLTRAMGHVSDVFDERILADLTGPAAIGHVRYSTSGDSRIANAQPILIDCAHGQIALCHNGNLVNAGELRDDLVRRGSIFQTGSDTEVVLHLYAKSRASSAADAIVESVSQVRGAFSLAMLTPEHLIAVRDPHGFRPLALGRLGDAHVVCSETCALDLIGARYERDVAPGEVLVIGTEGVRSFRPFAPVAAAHCVFEHVYFARPDSYVFEQSVNEVRTNLGRRLAREAAVEADAVVPIPDSGLCAAMGYAEQSGIPLKMGLIRNHFVGRTFIQPQQAIRAFKVKVKLNTVRSILDGQRVVLVDDSIVRGTTSRKNRVDDQGGGRRRGTHADQLSAHRGPLLLRDRHAAPRRADRGAPRHRRDPRFHGRRHPGLPEHRRAARGGRSSERRLLHGVLHEGLSGEPATRPAGLHADGAQDGGRRAAARPGPLMDYRAAGVDVEAANALVARLRELARGTFTGGVLTDIGAFGGVFRPDLAGLEDPVLVASADGVGTKLKVALRHWPPTTRWARTSSTTA